MARLSNLEIKQFRGIKDLSIKNLNIVNILVGDNNSGKTSVLEALQLLNPSCNIGSILKIAKQRESLFGINTTSIYDNFIYMFPHDTPELKIEISANCYDGCDTEDISLFEHLKGNLIDNLIKNNDYKDVCLKAVRLFDPDIEDIFYIKSDFGNKPIEYVRHRELGNMPLSTFGDGIKKVIVLANSIALSQGGILLIDEIETAIHKKYYYDIFSFLIKTSKIFNVQLFITTHSLEAIDGLLETQNYNEQSENDDIVIATLKRENHKTYSRVLSGREVFQDRENFGFEVRL